MKREFWVLLTLIFFFACSESLPHGVISKKKMEEVLLDVHILDGRLSSMPLDSTRATIDSYYEQLFKYHRIDSTIFRQSIEYYTSRPTVLTEMYGHIQSVLEQGIREEQELRLQQYEAQRKLDSVFQAKVQDSIRIQQHFALENRLLRDILFRPEADSTRDPNVPYTFDRYSIKLFKDQNLWKLNYGIKDSLMETFTNPENWNTLKSEPLQDSLRRKSTVNPRPSRGKDLLIPAN